MDDEINQTRNALVETITARKLVEQKLSQAKKDLALWTERLEALKVDNQTLPPEVEGRIRKQALAIAEMEAEVMAQGDQEKQLRATIMKLENSMGLSPPTSIPDSHLADETIERMEHKILAQEAESELSHEAEKAKLRKQVANMELDQELEELKKKMEKKNSSE